MILIVEHRRAAIPRLRSAGGARSGVDVEDLSTVLGSVCSDDLAGTFPLLWDGPEVAVAHDSDVTLWIASNHKKRKLGERIPVCFRPYEDLPTDPTYDLPEREGCGTEPDLSHVL